MAIKKIPQRRCLGCNESKDKKDLIRVVKNNQDEISIDLIGKKPGRGAYICHDIECLKKAKKAKRIERAFSMQIEEDIFLRLEKEIQDEQ